MSIIAVLEDEFLHSKFEDINFFSINTHGIINQILSDRAALNSDHKFWVLRCYTLDPQELVNTQRWSLYEISAFHNGYWSYGPFSQHGGRVSLSKSVKVFPTPYQVPQDPNKNILTRPTQQMIFQTLIDNFLSAVPQHVGQAIWDVGVTSKSPILLGLGAAMSHAPEIYRFLLDLLSKIFAGGKSSSSRGGKGTIQDLDLVFHHANEPVPDVIEVNITNQQLRVVLQLQNQVRAWCHSMKNPLGVDNTFLDGQLDQFVALLQGLNTAYKFYGMRSDPTVTDLLDLFDTSDPQVAAQIVQTNPLVQSIVDATCYSLNSQVEQQINNILNQTINQTTNELTLDFDQLGSILDGYFMQPGPAGGRENNLWDATDHAINLKIVARNSDVTDWYD